MLGILPWWSTDLDFMQSIKLRTVIPTPGEARMAFLATREVNMVQESMEIQNKTRDLRISKRTFNQPIAKILFDGG